MNLAAATANTTTADHDKCHPPVDHWRGSAPELFRIGQHGRSAGAREEVAEHSDRPCSENARSGPAGKPVFRDKSVEQLIPFILGEKELPEDQLPAGNKYMDQQLAATDWFVYRTHGDPQRRAQLAERIIQPVLEGDDVHSNMNSFFLLGELDAQEQIFKMFCYQTDPECCAYQELMDVYKPRRKDIPTLIRLIDTETEMSGPAIRWILVDATGVEGGEEMSREQWEQWWEKQDAATARSSRRE